MRHRLPLIAALLAGALPALAQDLSVSTYGTIGYARSNRDYTYQRSIDSSGTFARDSVLGLQGDLRFTPQWSATVQLKAAQSLKSDDRWDLRPQWAFLAWRPGDDWLLRAGRLRMPLYLHSESLDVGITHDLARLPAEMYSIAPSTEYDGAAFARSWQLEGGELSLDGYSGRIGTTARFWIRNGNPPEVSEGAKFVDVSVKSRGLVLTWRTPDSAWRAGIHRTHTRQEGGRRLPVKYPFVEAVPGSGIGYYQVDPQLPGPGLQYVDAVQNTVISLGLEQPIAPGWRVMAEYARMRQSGSELGSESDGGYVALLHRIGAFTPYASVARLKSSSTVLGWRRNLSQTQLPPFVPGAAQVNTAMGIASDLGYAADQRSWAVGTSWALDSRQKLKLEYLRTKVGQTSRLVDSPLGQPPVQDTAIGVWSVNYNFSF